ncbi:MAG: DUF2339 domain-containing protein, partial [Gaiellaceae bacterium]
RQIESLERSLGLLEQRVNKLEKEETPPPEPAPAPAPSVEPAPPAKPFEWEPRPPTTAMPAEPVAPAPPREREFDLEQLLGGRLLAWAGGVAIVLGAVFFVTMAIRRGWIGEGMRVLLAFLCSTALLAAGVWLHERKGQTQTAKIMVAAAIAAQYASLTAATALYGLVTPIEGFLIAGLVGAAASAIAVRWDSVQIAGIGILGALLAPVLVDAGTSISALVFMALALISAIAVVIWERWPWLATLAYFVSLPQLLLWVNDTHEHHTYRALAVLLAFWLLYMLAAIGYDLRVASERLRVPSAMLAFSNVVVTSAVGYGILRSDISDTTATTWVLLMAALHVVLGFAIAWRRSSAKEIALLAAAIGIGLSAIGLALALDGPALVSCWAVEAALLAWLARRTGSARAVAVAFGFLILAGARALDYERLRIDHQITGTKADTTAFVALLVVAVSAIVVARLLPRRLSEAASERFDAVSTVPLERLREAATPVLDAVAIAFVAVALDAVLSGWKLPVAWVALASALVLISRKLDSPTYSPASAALLVPASLHVLFFDVPPRVALNHGLDRVGLQFVALLVVVAGWVVVARSLRIPGLDDQEEKVVRAQVTVAAAIAALYLGSALIVSLAPASKTGGTQVGQMLLSIFWAACGFASLAFGLVRRLGWARAGGFCLLVLAAGKVFLYDLASLDQMARVLSLLGLGLLLLAATFLYQRLNGTGDKQREKSK